MSLAERNPRAEAKEKIQFVAGGLVKLATFLTMEQFEELERFQSLQAKKNKIQNKSQAIAAAVHIAVEKCDPVKKAGRAKERRDRETPKTKDSVEIKPSGKNPAQEKPAAEQYVVSPQANGVSEHNNQLLLWARRVELHEIETTYGRKNTTAAQINAVQLRDEGKCVYQCADGRRCGSDRWVNIHHIVEVSKGGSNHPTNLVTLCPLQHDLVHQMSFDFGKRRAPQMLQDCRRPYGSRLH